MPTRPTSKLPILILVGLLGLTVAAVPAQTHIPPPSGSDPGDAGPWKLPGRDPELDRRIAKALGRHFARAHVHGLRATRKGSAERYLLGRGFRAEG